MSDTVTSAIILFAHGSRDTVWAVPFERVLADVTARAPQRKPMLAFLEIMQPDLNEAIATQVERGFAAIRIVPLFLGFGGHLRNDLPKIVEQAQARHPGLRIEIAPPAGEDARVIDALAAYCLA